MMKKHEREDTMNEDHSLECAEQNIAYTYMVECGDGSIYTGWTKDIERRLKQHNAGKGAKYTRSRLPVRLLYYEEHATKREAMQREYAIKQMTRQDKLRMIKEAGCKSFTDTKG